MADLSFVDVLATLQGAMGEPVEVLACSAAGRPRGPAAMLAGTLGAGPDARELLGDGAPEDAVLFVLGVDGQGVTGYLLLDPASFERAFHTSQGALTIAQGGIVFVVRLPD